MSTLTVAIGVENGVDASQTSAPLFQPVLDRISLTLPFIFLAVTLYYVWSGDLFTYLTTYQLSFITSYVFLDLTHTGFTLLMFFVVPEVRSLLMDSIRLNRLWVYLSVGLFLTFPIFLAANWRGIIGIDPVVTQFTLCAINGLWLQHSISQVYGISLLYNRQAGCSPRSAMWERRLFKVLIYMSVLSAFITGIDAPLSLFTGAAMLIPYIAVLAILILTLHQQRDYPSDKLIFQSRLLLWLAGFLHPLAMMGIMAFHAIEYLCVSHQMVMSSKVKKTLWSVMGILSLAFVAYPGLRWYFSLSAEPVLPALVLLAAIGRTCDYFHYFADGIIFRFKDERVRSLIGPLFASRH